jgi:hypothetical protein
MFIDAARRITSCLRVFVYLAESSRLLTTLLARTKRSYPRSSYYLSLLRPAQYWYAEDNVNNQPRLPRFDYNQRKLTT